MFQPSVWLQLFWFHVSPSYSDSGLCWFFSFTDFAISQVIVSRQRLGEGGFGIVYRAMSNTGKQLAVKVIHRNVEESDTAKKEALLMVNVCGFFYS